MIQKFSFLCGHIALEPFGYADLILWRLLNFDLGTTRSSIFLSNITKIKYNKYISIYLCVLFTIYKWGINNKIGEISKAIKSEESIRNTYQYFDLFVYQRQHVKRYITYISDTEKFHQFYYRIVFGVYVCVSPKCKCKAFRLNKHISRSIVIYRY